ncbi:MAG: translation initiation factor IF-2 [Deltaproteobacteria bacterium]|nr:translation initiation factor IF-2 [Deltaproteobacteria bacterium]MBW2660497.1 translation initiation factor IF-2 [Deltaproteobacteria bacterium]
MAKIRVYEFARTLNMQNKALLNQLREMGVDIKSHMSSLDDETVAKIKEKLFNTKTEVVEVIRVKPTVIRRRKKAAKGEADSETARISKTAPKIGEVEELSEKAVKNKETPEKKETKKPVKKANEKIITKQVQDAKDVAKPSVRKKAVPETIEPEKERLDELKPEKPVALKISITKKQLKKDTPAKIIKMPSVVKKQVSEIKKPAIKAKKAHLQKGPIPKKVVPTEDATAKEKKQAKQYKKHKDSDKKPTDIKWTKKKISFRKKEVVEGKDLYAKGRSARKGRKFGKGKAVVHGEKPQITIPKAIKRRIKIDDAIVLSELAKRMGIKAGEMIKTLMSIGVMATVNQTIDFDTAVLLAAEFNYEIEKASFEEEPLLKVKKDEPGKLVPRPPVVTIMGHVDHGKTSLLDLIRNTRVTEHEAGGITQHIGAYHVLTDKGSVVFLDTPGHEAFTAMRSRGAKLTDLVVLVVAADDGVMPQTVEAINHSKAANVPIIVAINKIDKNNADPERVQRELADIGLVPEDWGGDTSFIKVSAKENRGIDDLLEMILLQAEILELKANPDKLATGRVVEAKIDSGRGAVATILIQNGSLHVGDHVVCGIHYGKIRAMINDRGVMVKSAGPSMPVEILGLSGVPNAGDDLTALSDDKLAKQVSLHRIQKQRSKDLAKTSKLSLENLYETIKEGKVNNLNIIIKTDVDGSIEAISKSLTKLSNDEVKINVLHAGTGAITETDVSLASVSNAIIIGFNVRPNAKTLAFASEEKVDIRYYNIIYNIIREIKDAIVGMMSSTYEERILGRADIRDVFHIPKIGVIAGAYVTDGKIERGKFVRLLRDGITCHEGKLSSLHRFKDDVKEVQSGYECGIGIENYNDIKAGDTIECYYLEEIKPKLEE